MILKSSFRKLYGRYGDLILPIWSLPLTNGKYHSGHLRTVTSQPIRLSTNFMTSIQNLTFTELWVVSMEHVRRVWHASRECLPFRTPGSVLPFGTCLCSNCWDQISQPCRVFTRLFTLNTSWYFRHFALKRWSEKGRDLTQSYDKSPYTNRKIQIASWQHKNATKNFDYTTIADRLRTVSWGNDSHPTGVVKPVYGIPTFQLTAKAV